MIAEDVFNRLQAVANPQIAAHSARFFKTAPGQYGHGDLFIGIRVPVLRQIAKQFSTLADVETLKLLHSEIHEARLLALCIWLGSLKPSKATLANHRNQEVYELYMANLSRVNNWDLVDTSAPGIVGAYLFDKSRRPLYTLAKSSNLWERRIAILATLNFIKRDDFDDTLKMAEKLLRDEEDLIHKAVGWMLRELGKRDETCLKQFLALHAATMPRTILRYAIERLSDAERARFMRPT